MANTWLESLQTAGLYANEPSVEDLRANAQSVVNDTVICPLIYLGLIRAEGDDASGFLHNQLTNDVNGLDENTLRRAGFCTPKGRMLADFLLWRDSAGVTLQLSAELLPAILKKLSMYVLRSKVKLSDISDAYARIGIAGPQADDLLKELGLPQPHPLQQQRFDAGTVLCLSDRRFEVVAASEAAAPLWQSLSAKATPVGNAAWQGLDIAAGIPQITAATVEAFVPQMVNYELIGGVSFKKGCYPGQEIVARTHYLGKIKRRMYRAHSEGNFVQAGTSIYAPDTGDQACGMVVTAAPSSLGGFDILLTAQSSSVAAGQLHLGNPAGPTAKILPLPYSLD